MSFVEKYRKPETKPQFKIFDFIVSLPIIRILKPLYEWNRGFWIYCFLGFLSVVFDWIASYFFDLWLPNNETLITAIAWCISTFLSYIMFRYLYFDRTNNSFLNELIKFIPTRIFTFVLGEVVVFIFVELLDFNYWIIKAILIPTTAILNYITSKLFVFK